MKRFLLILAGVVAGYLGSYAILKLFYLWYMPRYDTGFDHQTKQIIIAFVTMLACAVIGGVAAWWKTRPKR